MVLLAGWDGRQVGALAMLGVGSAFGTITTMPDLKHIAGPGTTDDVACIFNNVLVPAGEVSLLASLPPALMSDPPLG